jgi:hypothetical protein
MTYTKAAGNTYELAGPKVCGLDCRFVNMLRIALHFICFISQIYTQREVAEFVMEYCRFPTNRHKIVSIPSSIAK